MRSSKVLALCAVAAAVISWRAAGPLRAQTPVAVETKGMPPRAAPTDYAAHIQAGKVTIAADFTGHTLNTQDGLLHTEDYVVLEVGIFGSPEMRLMLSPDDFSLRINGAKKPLPSEPYETVGKSVKDPDYQEPEANKSSKTVVNSGGGKADGTDPNAPPPALIPIPFEIKRGWQLRVKRDSLPIGDRALPVAGMLFFPHSAGVKSIRSMELIYSGPAGKATMPIHP